MTIQWNIIRIAPQKSAFDGNATDSIHYFVSPSLDKHHSKLSVCRIRQILSFAEKVIPRRGKVALVSSSLSSSRYRTYYKMCVNIAFQQLSRKPLRSHVARLLACLCTNQFNYVWRFTFRLPRKNQFELSALTFSRTVLTNEQYLSTRVKQWTKLEKWHCAHRNLAPRSGLCLWKAAANEPFLLKYKWRIRRCFSRSLSDVCEAEVICILKKQ